MKVTHIISGLTNGGAEAVLYQMCINDKYNHHIVISLTKQGKYDSMLRDAGIEVHTLNMKGLKLSELFKLYSLIRHIKSDVVQTWMYRADCLGGAIAKIAGAKSIHWGIHATILDSTSDKKTLWLRKINAITSYFIPNSIICCAKKSLEVHSQQGFKKDKLVVVHNGYNLSQFDVNAHQRTKVRRELSLKSNSLVIGLVGRFIPQKDHKNLLQALSIVKGRYPSVKCLLIGPDINDSNATLNKWIDSMALRENVLLLNQREDIPAIMNSLDVHVLSSSGEAFPNVLNEAMACGVPCVTTDIGDAAIIVGDTGWVVPPKNSIALAGAIIEALEEKQNSTNTWKTRKKKARNRIEKHFSMNAMISGYQRVWQKY